MSFLFFSEIFPISIWLTNCVQHYIMNENDTENKIIYFVWISYWETRNIQVLYPERTTSERCVARCYRDETSCRDRNRFSDWGRPRTRELRYTDHQVHTVTDTRIIGLKCRPLSRPEQLARPPFSSRVPIHGSHPSLFRPALSVRFDVHERRTAKERTRDSQEQIIEVIAWIGVELKVLQWLILMELAGFCFRFRSRMCTLLPHTTIGMPLAYANEMTIPQ